MIKAIIFDMDNTLFDFVEAKLHACREITKILGRDEAEALYQYFVYSAHGYESHENIRDYLEERRLFSEEGFGECCRVYEEEKVRILKPFPGVYQVLEAIKVRGLRMAIVTDAHNGNALRRLRKLDLERFFDALITCDMTGQKKPSLVPFILAMGMLGTTPGETLVIGDSLRRDIAPAKTLGLITAYAKYGDRNLSEYSQCRPDFILETVDGILKLMDGEL